MSGLLLAAILVNMASMILNAAHGARHARACRNLRAVTEKARRELAQDAGGFELNHVYRAAQGATSPEDLHRRLLIERDGPWGSRA